MIVLRFCLAALLATLLANSAACTSKAEPPNTESSAHAAHPQAEPAQAKSGSATTAAAQPLTGAASPDTASQRIEIEVIAGGYEPSAVEARAGVPLTLVFKRTTDEGCGQELVFPGRDIRHALPLNEEVEVELTPNKDETIAFTCGMGMYKGSVVAVAR